MANTISPVSRSVRTHRNRTALDVDYLTRTESVIKDDAPAPFRNMGSKPMATITKDKTIQASVEKVFSTFTNLREAPSRIKGITKMEALTDGPIGVGARLRKTRIMFRIEATEKVPHQRPHRHRRNLAQKSSERLPLPSQLSPPEQTSRINTSFLRRRQPTWQRVRCGKIRNGGVPC